MSVRAEILSLLAEDGVIARRRHPELESGIAWLARRGELTSVLPGVYAATGRHLDFHVRIAALVCYDPDAVIIGRAAAKLSFWPKIRADVVDAATLRPRRPQTGFAFVRRRIPPELVVFRARVPMTAPQLTAIDLCDDLGGDGIDEVLRTGAARLDQLQEALDATARRPGHPERRRLVVDSRDEPWSAGERKLHRLLRQANITGWQTNMRVRIAGQTYYIDVAFEKLRLAVEFDGKQFHGDDAFERDRWRQNALVLDGWTVLRFTWAMLVDHPEIVIRHIRTAIASLENRR